MKAKRPRSERIQVYRRADGVVIAYDLQNRRLLHDLVDYSIYLVDDLHLNSETVYQRVLQIAVFVEELVSRRLEYWQIDDTLLKDFRGRQMMIAMGGFPNGTPDAKRRAEQTLNAILHPTLSWLFWLSDRGLLLPNQIGPLECQITCTRSMSESGRVRISGPHLFPWRRSGGYRIGKTPSDTQLDLGREYLLERACSEYGKQRNLMIFDFALESGLRADSIAALRASQFDALAIQAAETDTYALVPDRQKGGHHTEYLIPISLASKVANYISTVRAEFLKDKNLSSATTADGVFLSEKNGKPIVARTLSTIMSGAMRHAGLLPGSGAHALRRRFADDKIVQIICYRIENDMDTSALSIAFELEKELGHTTRGSLSKYISSNSSRLHREAKKML